MKTEKEIRRKVGEVLTEKISDLVKGFQAEREKELSELIDLTSTIEDREAQKEKLDKTLSGLNLLREQDKRVYNESSLKLHRIERDLISLNERADKLLSKLTFIPPLKMDDPVMNLLLFVTGKVQ